MTPERSTRFVPMRSILRGQAAGSCRPRLRGRRSAEPYEPPRSPACWISGLPQPQQQRRAPVYTHNGDSFFVVDGHLHFWDASPANWVSGQEQYAKGWIECFHAYMGLGPEETHWPIEKFQKYSEDDFVKDVFEDGHVDVGIFQSTYLKEWYTDGFNTLEKNAELVEKYPDRLIANGRWDPREGEAGLKQLEDDAKRYNLPGVKP